ncbi:MAG TPA: hypothetical protein VGG00_02990 [Rhodanobacter sp.]|jgi:hypothetical protein
MISRLTAYAVTTAVFAALLSACGGSSGGSNLSSQANAVSVSVSGLSGSLALQLTPGDSTLTVTANGLATFSGTVNSGGTYGVTITTQPAGQYCTLGNNAGTANAAVIVTATCNTSVGGVWKASNGTTQYLEIADELGDFYVLGTTSPSVGYGVTLTELDVGLLSVSNNTVTGTYVGVSGNSPGSGTVSGTVVSQTALDLTTQFASSTSTTSQTLNYAYDALYQVPSSLSAIASNYIDSQNDVWSISISGLANVQSASTGCVGNGQVSLIDGRYNVYNIQFTYALCTGSSAYLNGAQFFGIVTLDTESSPTVLLGGATAELPNGSGELIVPLVLQSN